MNNSIDKQNLLIDEFTSVDPITVCATNSLDIVKTLMLENKIRHIPVVEGKSCVGLISERDLHSLGQNQLLETKASEIMISPYTVKSPSLS